MKIGEKIKAKRLEQRMSAQDLAIRLGVSKENVYKWEKGSTPSDPEVYTRIQAWLNNVDHIPQPHSTSVAEDGHTVTYDALLDRYFKLSDRMEELIVHLEQLQSNLNLVLAHVERISMARTPTVTVILEALARLEKKPHNYLVEEVDKRTHDDILKHDLPGKRIAKRT